MRCLLTSWSVNQSKLEKREFTKKYSFALLQQQQEYDSKLLCLLWITLNRFEKVTQPKVQSWYYRVSAWWARRCTLEEGMGGHLKAGLTDAPRTTLCGRRSTGCNIASRLSLSVLTLTPLLLLLLLLLPVHSHTDADIWIAGEEIVQIWGWTKNMTRVTLFTLEEWSRWDFLC